MASNTFNGNHKSVYRRRHVAFPDSKRPGFVGGVCMDSPNPLHVLHHVSFQHLERAERTLLPRLKNNFYRPGKFILSLIQQNGASDSRRNMKIMPAGMHFSFVFGSIGEICLLTDWQGVYIAAKGLYRPFFYTSHYSHKPRLQSTWQNFHSCFRKNLTNLIRSSVFLIGQLGMAVKPLEPFR